MPLRPLTITLNADNSKKFPVLLPDDAPDARRRILQDARNKFRLKALAHVFLPGGRELADGEELGVAACEVFVSKGEPFNGRAETPPTLGATPAEVRILADASFIDDKAATQLRALAALDGVRPVCGMPDLHPGDRFPVGCAAVADGVYPALVGGDVGCGVALYRLSFAARSAADPARLAARLRGLDGPWDGCASAWLAKYGLDGRAEFDGSLGSVGLGNHFAEICTVERVVDEDAAARLGIRFSDLCLMVHTGSRGIGASILSSATQDSSNPYIPPDSPLLAPYLAEHDYATKWAVANRDLVAYRIQCCLRPPLDEGSSEEEPDSATLSKLIDITHNSVSPSVMDINGETRQMWIHRKGAAPSDRGVVPCPGSRGDFSWLLQPCGDGTANAHSLAHGAGRRHPRQVMHSLAGRLPKAALTTTALGSEVVCTDPELLLEEAPEAYKGIQCVVDDMEASGICKGIIVLRPVVSYKVREGGQRRRK